MFKSRVKQIIQSFHNSINLSLKNSSICLIDKNEIIYKIIIFVPTIDNVCIYL